MVWHSTLQHFWHTWQNSLDTRNTGVNIRTSSEWLACMCWEQWISELDFTTTLTTVLDIFQSWALLWTEKQTNIFIPRANLTAGLKIARLLLGMLNMQSYQTKLIKLKPLKAQSFCSRLTVWKTKDFGIILCRFSFMELLVLRTPSNATKKSLTPLTQHIRSSF